MLNAFRALVTSAAKPKAKGDALFLAGDDDAPDSSPVARSASKRVNVRDREAEDEAYDQRGHSPFGDDSGEEDFVPRLYTAVRRVGGAAPVKKAKARAVKTSKVKVQALDIQEYEEIEEEGKEQDEEEVPEPAPKRGRGPSRKTPAAVSDDDFEPKPKRLRPRKIIKGKKREGSAGGYGDDEPKKKKAKQAEKEVQTEVDEEGYLIINPWLKSRLEDPVFARTFTSALIEDAESGANVKVLINSVAQIDDGEGGSWMGEIHDIKGLHSDITLLTDPETGDPVLNKKGEQKKGCEPLWIKTHWLYTAEDFRKAPVGDDQKVRFKSVLKYMGKNERVRTDHGDWYLTKDVINLEESQIVYGFDDSYPACEPEDRPSDAPYHPLCQPFRSVMRPSLPNYLFADEGDGTQFTRTDFGFGPVAAEDGSEDQARTEKLEYNLHSTSQTPYNPTQQQRYSHTARKWFNVSELLKRKSYVKAGDDDGPRSRTRQYGTSQAHDWDQKRAAEVDEGDDSDSSALSVPAGLKDIATTMVVRGGIFGLTGNVHLVQLAQGPLDGGLTGEELETEGSLDQLESELVDDALQWKKEALKRQRAAKGDIAKTGGLPKGMVWICPESGDRI